MDETLDDYQRVPLAAVLMFYTYRSDLPFTVRRKDKQRRCFKTDAAKPPADNEHQMRESFAVIQIKLFMFHPPTPLPTHCVGADD